MPKNLLFDCNGEAAAQAATQALVRQGLHVVRSFDLYSALAAHADGACPQHGTEQCTCQFVVLLVYGNLSTSSGRAPVVVTTHSRDGHAEFQIVNDANERPDEYLAERVWVALLEAALSAQQLPDLAAKATAVARQEIA